MRASKNVNGSTAVFTYDGTKLLTEQTAGQTKTNIHGTNLIATAGSDMLYYQYNNHGDVISVLDQAGEVKNEYDYDAFGNAITEKETVSNPYRYAGYYQDSESGLYYLQSRYYNPRTARFLTEDTASGKYTDPLSLNKYTYCHNQPVTGYDPDGHFLHIVARAAIGALVSGGLSYASQAIKNKSFTKGINWQKVAGSAAEGAIIGGVGAATGGAGLAASAAGTAAKTGAKTVAKTTAKAVAKKVAINVAGNAAGNVANQAISKGVKKISAKEAAVAGATGILDVAGDAAGTALKKAGSKVVRKIAGAAAEGAGAIAAKKAGAKAAQKALGTSAEAGLAGAGKNAVSSQQGLGKKLLDGIDNLKSTGKALLKDEGGFLDLDALAGKKSVSGAVGKSGTPSTTDRIRNVAQQSFDYAVNNPRKQGLNRMQLGKDAEIQATRWTRKWAERNGIDLSESGLHFQVRGEHSISDVVYEPTKNIMDFKLTPKAVRKKQSDNFKSDFPGYSIEYIFGPGPWREQDEH